MTDRIRTEVPGPRSQILLARQRAALPAGLGSALPVFVESAAGGEVVDVDGNTFIDFGSGIAVTTVGNSAPRVVARATEQLRRFTHTCYLVNPYESYVAVCEKLNELAPVAGEARTALFNSGAEAVENAVKVARAATGRPGIVVFDHAFHGRTLLTMALTAKNIPYKQGFGPFVGDVHRAPMAYPYRWPTGPRDCAQEAADALADLIDRQAGADTIAAVVIEPIQGEGGFIVPAPGFLPKVRQICSDRGLILIADEVQSGIARTGTWFASEHEGIRPDLVTSAKGLGGGLPIAAVTGRADLMDAAPAGGLGGTFSGNPVACAAALGVFEEIEEHNLLARARRIGEIMLPALHDLQRSHDAIGDVRGRGAMIAIELVHGDRRPNPDLTARIAARCHREGLLVLTAGSFGNVLRFLPPLSISDDLLMEGLSVLRSAIAAEA
ncbi:4-aminobutyrate--2-oxoglutarate transaminase [Amycolatopsis jejuensis]|uniref:4-aminobutyrate--2-oxoglutarate transaminase n=1 Tax=Amycolatopsis jejuensis TaxID=330084 RepID=UPI000527C4D0|nr:4-aminobutyrate--2-oxoglutarate transaminase [Amycolatopsis jejuensis]